MVCSFRTWRTRCSHHFQMKTQGKACTGWAPCLMQRQEREGGLSAGTFTGTSECSFISKCEFLNIQPISRDRARTLKIQEQSCVKTLCTQTGLSSYSFFLPMAKPLLMWPGLCHSFSHFCFCSTCLDLGRSFHFHTCLIEPQPPSCPLCSFLLYCALKELSLFYYQSKTEPNPRGPPT